MRRLLPSRLTTEEARYVVRDMWNKLTNFLEREGNEDLQTKWSDIIGNTKEDSILSSVYKLIAGKW